MGKRQIDSQRALLGLQGAGKTTLVGEKGMRSVNAILRVPRVIRTDTLRPYAGPEGSLQPSDSLQA
jgi:signal recognition particle GTPase